jgi:hypothetical protein
MRTKLRSKLSLLFVVFGVLLAFPAVALADQLANNVDDSIDATVEELSLESGKTRTVQIYVNPQGPCDITGTESIRVSVTSSNTSRATARWTDGQADITDSGKQILFKGCGTENGKNVTVKAETEIGASNITFKVEQNNAGSGSMFITDTATFRVNTVSDQLANDADNTIDATVEEFSLESHGKTRTVKVFVDPILEVCNFDPNSNEYINVRINQSHSNASGTTARWDVGQGATNNDLDMRFTGCGTENGKRVLVTSGDQTGSVTISFTIDQNNAGGTFATNTATFKANITRDVTAPTVTSVVPAENATNVAVGTNVQATFSEAMNSGTVSGSTFTLTAGNNQVGANVNYATNKATLTPNADLQANTQYTATIVGGANGVKDLAGNALTQSKTWSFTTAAPPTPADDTPPDITPNVQGTLGNNGWYTSNVSVSWTVTDGESTITSKTGCDPTTISQDNGPNGQMLTCTATSAGGTDRKSVTIKRDATAPVITDGGAKAPANGANGWYVSEAFNTFSASDGANGSGLADPTRANFDVGTGSQEDSELKVASGPISDVAGNTAASKTSTASFNVDLTNPTIQASLDPASPAASGWYNASTGAPTVKFVCADKQPGSGLAQGACPADHTFGNGENQSHSGTVTDIAGLSATASVNDVDVDLDPPSKPVATTTPANPVPNSGDFFKDTVTVSYGGSTDVGPSGVQGYSPDQTFNTSGSHTYSGIAKDNAGNESEAVTGTVKVDAVAPTVQISGCPANPVLLNSSQSITVAASDEANGSGLASDPSGQVSLDTSSVGSKTKTVTATDRVGHQELARCDYSVIYNFSGFRSPVDNPGTGTIPVFNSAKAGQSIPIKFSLSGNQGLGIIAAGYPKATATACPSSSATVDSLEEYATTTANNGLTYDATADQYNYVWKTQSTYANKCFKFNMVLIDGTSHVAYFKFTK